MDSAEYGQRYNIWGPHLFRRRSLDIPRHSLRTRCTLATNGSYGDSNPGDVVFGPVHDAGTTGVGA